jgi:glycosyltransferase involved in cell wall biosynthesis
MTHTQHIGFYCSSQSWGGLEMNTLRYAKWMQEAGKKVTVFVVDLSRMHQEAIRLELSFVLINKHRKYLDIKEARSRAKLFDQLGIDVIWFRDNYDFDLLAWAKRFAKNKFKLLYQQAMQMSAAKKSPLHFLQHKACDAWVATLPYLAEQAAKWTYMSKKNIHVNPLGVELKRPTITFTRKQINIEENAFVIGIIGRLDPTKDQMSAIHALHLMSAQYPQLHLVIVGESTLNEGNAYEIELKRKVNHFDLQSRVHFLPYSSNVANEFALFDVFLLSSMGETFGTVTIEAMGYGKAVIGTNTSGTPEILDHGKCGLLYTPYQVDELVEKIKTYIEEPSTKMKMEQAARQRFEMYYSKEASMSGLLKIVNQWH